MTHDELMTDALESLSHMGAEQVDAAGGFVAVRVPCKDGGEVLVNPSASGWDGPPGWDVGRYGPEGENGPMATDVAGEDLVKMVSVLTRPLASHS